MTYQLCAPWVATPLSNFLNYQVDQLSFYSLSLLNNLHILRLTFPGWSFLDFRFLWTAVVLVAINNTALNAQDAPSDETSTQSSAATLQDKLRLSGDFRSRYEGFYKTNQPTRNRTRLRLRLRVDSEINDDTRFQLQVASGDPGTPASTNQTFKGFLSLAYCCLA